MTQRGEDRERTQGLLETRLHRGENARDNTESGGRDQAVRNKETPVGGPATIQRAEADALRNKGVERGRTRDNAESGGRGHAKHRDAEEGELATMQRAKAEAIQHRGHKGGKTLKTTG